MRLLVALLLVSMTAFAAPDPRYCGAPQRYEDGRIKRSAAAIAEFRANHPCPVTGKTDGNCYGWAVDHAIPLACGGCDSQVNMQWLPVVIKASSNPLSKDRWERRVYGSLEPIPDTANCAYPGTGQ